MWSRPARLRALIAAFAALSLLTLPAARPARSEALTAEQIGRIGQIKQLQQRRLMEEGLEARESNARDLLARRVEVQVARALAAGRARANTARTDATRTRRPSGGVAQRPASRREREEALAGPARRALRMNGALGVNAIAQDVYVNDPNTDDPAAAEVQSEASIGAWRNYVLAAWNDSQGHRLGTALIGIGLSTNNGQTFTDVGQPPDVSLPSGLWSTDPVVSVNEKTGDLYFCALNEAILPGDPNAYHGVGIAHGTFSGANVSWDRAQVIDYVGDPLFIDKPWIAADSLSGNIYLTYTLFTQSSDSILFRRSTDQGASWGPAITLSSPAGAGRVQGSRPIAGPNGEVYVVWQEIGTDQTGGADFFRLRKSTDFGRTFGPEVTVTSFYDDFGSGAPGFNRERGVTLPSIAVDRSTGPRRGRVYVTWNEAVNFYDSLPTEANPVNEIEPNDYALQAQAFTPGQMILGTFKSADDFDFYKFNAVQGTTYVFWTDRPTVPYTVRLFCTDSLTRLAFSGDRNITPRSDGYFADGFIVWTAPTTGTYYVRLVIFDQASGSYRLRSAIDTPGGPGQRARDHRDIFVASSPDGLNWSSPPTLVNSDQGIYDDWLPEIAVTADGTVYTAWYDWSDSPPETCGGESNTYLARSDDGGATWLSLGAASTGQTAWSYVNADAIPNQGDYIALIANNVNILPCWADGRLGNPNVMTSPILVNGLQVAVRAVVADAGHVAITWQTHGAASVTATVYRRLVPGAFAALTTLTSDAQGQIFYDDVDVTSGLQYQYRLGVIVNNVETFLGERTVVVPSPELDLQVNTPVRGVDALRVSFALPTTEKAWITLFDITGRRIRDWFVSNQGVGRHTMVDFGRGLDIKPGFYMLRLKQGEVQKVRRVSILP